MITIPNYMSVIGDEQWKSDKIKYTECQCLKEEVYEMNLLNDITGKGLLIIAKMRLAMIRYEKWIGDKEHSEYWNELEIKEKYKIKYLYRKFGLSSFICLAELPSHFHYWNIVYSN